MTKPEEERFSGKPSELSGYVIDPARYDQLSLEGKRQLVRAIAQSPEDAQKILSSLTRRELLEIICAEMGKERKYSGYTKLEMIKHLLKLVTNDSGNHNTEDSSAFSSTKGRNEFKRQKQQENLVKTPMLPAHDPQNIMDKSKPLCPNLACRASMNAGDIFCKRCSCCICHQFDENKDPSLWVTCDSDPLDEEKSCGVSCHLECALKHVQTSTSKYGLLPKLDGGFYCVSCGKANGLLRTWRRQLVAAKEARRVDALCLRLSLGHKILKGTEKYEDLLKTVESIVQKLESEVGPLDLASSRMDRALVNRLSCGIEVQKLCTSAVEVFDLMLSRSCSISLNQMKAPTCQIFFEDLSPTAVTVVLAYEDHFLGDHLGCKLWYKKSTLYYPEEARYIVLRPQKRFKLNDLDPSTEYSCKVSFFSNSRALGVWEATWITPALRGSSVSLSEEEKAYVENDFSDPEKGHEENDLSDEEKVHEEKDASEENGGEVNDMLDANQQTDSMCSTDNKLSFCDYMLKLQSFDIINMNKNDGSPVLSSSMTKFSLPSPMSNPPFTPCKSDETGMLPNLICRKHLESDYETSVKAIRRLEHEGHLDTEFRVKFLTWFSLKATMQQRRVVSVFIDTFVNDPSSLAGQLIHTFTAEIYTEQKQLTKHGFCTRLWH